MQGVSLRFRIGDMDLGKLFDFGQAHAQFFPFLEKDPTFFSTRRKLLAEGKAFYFPTPMDGFLQEHRQEFPETPVHT